MNLLYTELDNFKSYKKEKIDYQNCTGHTLVIGRNDENVDERDGNGCLVGETEININRHDNESIRPI